MIRQAFLRIPNRLTSTLQPITSRHASTLIIAEPSTTTTLAPATCSAITAAQKLHSGPITLLTLSTPSPTDPSTIPSTITHILNANLPSILAETASTAISSAHAKNGYTHIIAPATKFGSHVLPRAAALLKSSAVTDVVEVLGEDTFIRPLYAGNALCKVQCTESGEGVPTMITVRSTAFEKAEGGGSTADVQDLELDDTSPPLTELVGATVSNSNRPDLASASVVVSGGRGMKNGENFKLLEELADKLNGAVGASRAAVDAGFVPNDLQVGQTGKVVAPDLYIAVGISGAIQHLSGMKDSKTIVAVNNDPEAPIFQVADYGLADDLFKVVPEMTEKL